jgi:small-conductance mechanosensitive channel
MRTGANNLIVIPNNKLGQAIFTNYFLPDGRMGISLLCGVSQETDIDLAEKLLLDEIVQCAATVSNVMSDPPPVVRFNPGPWGASLVFQVAFSVTQFANVPLARSEVRKRLYKRLRGAGISVTFPATSTPE